MMGNLLLQGAYQSSMFDHAVDIESKSNNEQRNQEDSNWSVCHGQENESEQQKRRNEEDAQNTHALVDLLSKGDDGIKVESKSGEREYAAKR